MRLTGTVHRIFIHLGLTGVALMPVALAGGVGPQATSRTVPVAIMSFTIVSSPDGRPDGPFVCADGSGVVIESVPGALRLTRRGQVSTMNPVDLIRDAEGRFTLSLKGAAQTCRPAVPGDLTLKIGAPQFYACADAQQVVASPFPDAVLITSFSSGQRPDQSGVLPQISPGHYQNSEWSWRQSGAVWALKFHGKAAATGCRVLQ